MDGLSLFNECITFMDLKMDICYKKKLWISNERVAISGKIVKLLWKSNERVVKDLYNDCERVVKDGWKNY